MPLLVTSAADGNGNGNGNGYGALLTFDRDGGPLGTFSNDSRIADPRGLALHRDEGLLFLNNGTERVLAIDRDGRVVRDSGRSEGLNSGGGNFGPDGRYYVGLRSKRTVMAFSPRSTPAASMSCRAGSYRFPAALLSAAMAGCSSPRASARMARVTTASSRSLHAEAPSRPGS